MTIQYPVPFYPQKWKLDDWKELGFASYEDAEYWERSCCGILCLQMAVEYFCGTKFRTVDLIKQGQTLGAYTDAHGWSHDGLVHLAERIDMKATRENRKVTALAEHCKSGGLACISIKWGFLSRKSTKEKLFFWKKYGGHLALVVGVEMEKEKVTGFYVHHTSIRETYNWEMRFVPVKDFRRGYTGRCILISA